MDTERHTRPDGPRRGDHRSEHRTGPGDGRCARRPRRIRGARRPQRRQGQGCRGTHHDRPSRCGRHDPATGPVGVGVGARGGRRPAGDLRHDRPVDQQRRRHVHAPQHHGGRLRAAVRHQPPRSLRLHRTAARAHARRRRFARRHREQHRTPHPRSDRLRRSAVDARLQPGRGLRAVEAGEPVVHLRTAAPARECRLLHRSRSPRIPA